MPAIDRRFFRETYNAHQILSELSHTVRRLAAQPEKLLETVANKQKDALFQERRLLEQLHTRLIVPLATTERLLGFISLGEKLSEEPYSKEDKELLLAVAQ